MVPIEIFDIQSMVDRLSFTVRLELQQLTRAGELVRGGGVRLAQPGPQFAGGVATLSVLWAVLMPLLVWWAAVQTGKGQ